MRLLLPSRILSFRVPRNTPNHVTECAFWLGFLTSALMLLASSSALAQPSVETCLPGCRAGYICVQSQCVSICNPPCGSGQICTAEATCVGSPGQVQSNYPVQPATAVAVAAPVQVQHQNDSTPEFSDNGFRLHVGPRFAFGGEIKDEADVEGQGKFKGKVDLEPTFGFDAKGLFGFLNYASIGAGLRYSSVLAEDMDERQGLLDISVVARGRYPIHLGNMTLEPFAEFSVGPSVFFASDEVIAANEARGVEMEQSAIGYHVGFEVGAQLFFTKVIGVHAQLGWRMQSILTVDMPGIANTTSLEQFQLGLGASFRFGS